LSQLLSPRADGTAERSVPPLLARAVVPLGVLLIAVGGILVSPMADALSDGSSDGPTSVLANPAGLETGGPALPELSQEQKDRALAIARANPAVQSLIASRAVSTLVVPWYTLKSKEPLGAGIDLSWNEPIDVAAQWPTLFYDETETVSPPYQATTATIHATRVTVVHLAIDLTNGRVLGMHPLPGAKVTSLELAPGFRNTLPPQPEQRR
jgi:hypothetical protein